MGRSSGLNPVGERPSLGGRWHRIDPDWARPPIVPTFGPGGELLATGNQSLAVARVAGPVEGFWL